MAKLVNHPISISFKCLLEFLNPWVVYSDIIWVSGSLDQTMSGNTGTLSHFDVLRMIALRIDAWETAIIDWRWFWKNKRAEKTKRVEKSQQQRHRQIMRTRIYTTNTEVSRREESRDLLSWNEFMHQDKRRQCYCEMPYSKQQLLYCFFSRELNPNQLFRLSPKVNRILSLKLLPLLDELLHWMYSTKVAPFNRLPTP